MNVKQAVDMLELKASLLVEGVSASEDALTGVGTDYKEQNHGLFGWDMEDHVGSELPDDFLLPDGTVVQFRMNSSSPFCIRADDGGLKLFHRDRDIAGVQWIKRYYDTGIKAIGYSMEIWDEALYRAICPGKSESTSHAEFLRSIESAVGVFGEGNGLQRSFARLRVS